MKWDMSKVEGGSPKLRVGAVTHKALVKSQRNRGKITFVSFHLCDCFSLGPCGSFQSFVKHSLTVGSVSVVKPNFSFFLQLTSLFDHLLHGRDVCLNEKVRLPFLVKKKTDVAWKENATFSSLTRF